MLALAVEDPIGCYLSDSIATGDAMAAEPGYPQQSFEAWVSPDHEAVVGAEGSHARPRVGECGIR